MGGRMEDSLDEREILASLVRIAEEEGVFGIEVIVQGESGAPTDSRRYSIRLGQTWAPPLEGGAEEELSVEVEEPQAPAPVPREHIIRAPLVGIFHRSGEPGGAPLVEIGQMVFEGQPLCCIESLKVFREITSDVTGRVVDILARDEEPVDYGRPLLRIEALPDEAEQG